MRIGVIALVVAAAAPASADPDRLEASAFFGGESFASDVALGHSVYAEQRPQSAPMFGGRLTILALPQLVGDAHTHLDLGIEGELALAPSFTGYGFTTGRDSYFAPVFGWRGDVIARVAFGRIEPHLVFGGGGATVASTSPFMKKESVGELLWGVGVTLQTRQRWQVRVDLREGFLPTMSGGSAPSFEGAVAIGTTFGLPREHVVAPKIEPPPPRPVPPPDADRDGDGIPDALDKCPDEPETVNGIEDGDGCPEPDPDGDGILGDADRCPNEPEDFDHFQDEDGCPDPDNDADGIPDAKDKCPNEAETKNGFEDEDGCPDEVPPELGAAFAAAGAVRFEWGKPRVTEAAKKALAKVLDLLRDHPRVHVTLTVHPDAGNAAKTAELATKRGDAIKWYLQDQGVGADQVAVVVAPAPANGRAPMIEFALGAPKPASP